MDEKNVSTGKSSEVQQLEIETAKVNLELAKAKLEAQKQEIEDLKFKNEEARQRRAIQQARLKNARESDRRQREDTERKRAYCNHTQGGEGLDGLFQGDGLQSTYQREVGVFGEETFRCIRCGDEVSQQDDPIEFKRIKKLPHKGLVAPIPILFKYVDNYGNTVQDNYIVTYNR